MRRALLLLLLLPLLGACDLFEPSGPGSLTARVEARGAPLGAAVLRVEGTGIRGFTPVGSTRLFTREQPEPGRWRLVAVDPDGAELVFRIDVEDVGEPLPSTLIFSAVDTADKAVGAEVGVGVTIRRE